MRICVMLSSYNGEKYIKEQIDSILAQKIDGEMILLVRDDGSTDETKQILNEYKRKYNNISWYAGDNLKVAKSFWDLVHSAPDADYYAFCDQDDVWYPDKLERAINALGKETIPLLYASNVVVVDQNLNSIGNMVNGEKYTDFPHSLIYSMAPGCTFVFNKEALNILRNFDRSAYIYIHDWLAHQLIAMTGKVIYDSQPSMMYRQHGNNVIGAPKKGIKKYIAKVKRFLFGEFKCVRSNMAEVILNNYKGEISNENKRYLRLVAYYKTDKSIKKELLHEKCFLTNRKYNNLMFKIVVRMNKL